MDISPQRALSAIAPSLAAPKLQQEVLLDTLSTACSVLTNDSKSWPLSTIAKRWKELALPIDMLLILFTNNQTVEQEHIFELISAMAPAIASYENGQEMLG